MVAKKTTAPRRASKRTQPTTSTESATSTESRSRGPKVGDLVKIKGDDDAAPVRYGYVVDTVTASKDDNGNELRSAAVYVAPLPDAIHLELDQVETA